MINLRIETPEWAEAFLVPSRYKGAYGGRGSGKSHGFAENLIELMVMNQELKVVCIREVQKSLNKSVKALLENKIKKFDLGDYFLIHNTEIRCKNGDGVIIFQGMQDHTADTIKSLEGFDIAWVEEAQSLSYRSLKLLRPTIRKEGSEIWFTWNPENDSDPVDVLLRSEIKPKNAIVKKVNYKDNPWFPDVLEDERQFDRQHDPDGYGHTWDGDYVTASKARVFKNWIVEEFEAPADSMFRFGADWGFSVDPTTLVRCYMVGRKIYIDYEAYQVGCEIKDTPDLFMTVPESEMWPIVADSARPETISHIRKHGFPKIMKAIKGPKSLEEGVAFVKTYQLIIHPRCEHVIDELTHYKYKLDPATEKPTSILEDKHNHVIDALRYAVENVRRAVKANKTIDHKPIPRVNKW